MKELIMIQQGLKAPKGQFNKFGNYKYRSCEDILEAVKPLLDEQACTLVIMDDLLQIGERYYVKATATLTNSEGVKETATAFAREQESKAGMDSSQLTGSTSSYARKYALNGLFCIDDTKDADTMDNSQEGHAPAPAEDTRPWMNEKQLHTALDRIAGGMLDTVEQCKTAFRMKKEYREKLENAARSYTVKN
jgi:hypothetical protein